MGFWIEVRRGLQTPLVVWERVEMVASSRKMILKQDKKIYQ